MQSDSSNSHQLSGFPHNIYSVDNRGRTSRLLSEVRGEVFEHCEQLVQYFDELCTQEYRTDSSRFGRTSGGWLIAQALQAKGGG